MRRLLVVLRTLWHELRHPRRSFALVLVAALALQGCALTTSSVQHRSTVSLAAAKGVLDTLGDSELKLVCGRADSPQAPYCVPVPTHQKIAVMMQQAYLLHAQAARLVRDLGVQDRLPADVYGLLAQVQGLITAIVDLIPASPGKVALVERTGVGGK